MVLSTVLLLAVAAALTPLIGCSDSSDSGSPTGSGPAPVFAIKDYFILQANTAMTRCEFNYNEPGQEAFCWVDSVGRQIECGGLDAFEVFRIVEQTGGSWTARMWAFYRNDSLFFADSLQADSTFRYVYLVMPAQVTAGKSYSISNFYIDFGPENKACDMAPPVLYPITVLGLEDLVTTNGTLYRDCIKYSLVNVPGDTLYWVLHPSVGLAKAYSTVTNEGVETTDIRHHSDGSML